jgi:hypothetical protein
MSVIWLAVDDEPGSDSRRGYIERNAKSPVDPPSQGWLGHYSDRERVRISGLWNQNHVDEAWDAAFLDTFDGLISTTRRSA